MQPNSLQAQLQSRVPDNAETGLEMAGAEPWETYAQRFAVQAARTPAGLAAAFGGQELTYAQLNAQANQLAHHLQALGVGPESLVAICLDRSIELLVTLLAVWKGGGAYVPLDPEYPPERLAWMLADSQAAVLVTQQRFLPGFAASKTTVVCVDDPLQQWSWRRRPEGNPASHAACDNLAYVIYTSGSTGQPKGVEITHRALLSHNLAVAAAYRLGPEDRVLQFASTSFDISVEEIFPSWLSGSAVIVRSAQAAASPARFLSFVAAQRITVLNLPTAYWHELVEELGKTPMPVSVRLVVIGGEKASDAAYCRWKHAVPPSVQLINSYGPTEATVTTTIFQADPVRDTLPIGRPLPYAQVLLLDERREPSPPGSAGHLCIGGAGLARGYRYRPELTAERFIPNPFFPDVPSRRLYLTGDLARLAPDGNLEFVGRLDDQVKIRGFRIELGEVEAALRACPGVKDAVATAREDSTGGKRLVAYFVPQSGCNPSAGDLMAFLKNKIPAYMVPALFVRLPALPLSPVGKVDRRALPDPEGARPDLGQELVRARTQLEEQLSRIWREVLGLKQVGVKDNFFELGGDSLLATRVISRVRDQFNVEVSLLQLFDAPTIETLSAVLGSAQPELAPPASPPEPLPRQDWFPVSSVQEHFWLLDQLQPGGGAYNIAAALRLKGPLHLPALQRAFNALLRRHDILRAHFECRAGEPTQIIAPELSLPISLTDLAARGRRQDEARLAETLDAEARRPFNLDQGPLLRACLVRLHEADHAFLLVIHHTISDGWSLGLFFQELAACYNACLSNSPLPPPASALQYADYAQWQRHFANGPQFQAHLDYWIHNLAGAPETMRLPFDAPKAPAKSPQAARRSITLSPKTFTELETLARSNNATPFMVLFAALAITLYRWTRQEDQVIGTLAAGRNHREFETMLGCFVNFLPLRIQLRGDETGGHVLHKVRSLLLKSQPHQDCPFARIVAATNPHRRHDRTPLYNVAFLCHNYPGPDFRSPNLQATPIVLPPRGPLLDLRFEAEPVGNAWSFACEYPEGLFAPKTIAQILSAFAHTLRRLSRVPNSKLDAFPLLQPGSRSWFQRLWQPRAAPRLQAYAE